VRFAPALPPEWPGAQVTLRWRGHVHVFDLVREAPADAYSLVVNEWLDLDTLHADTQWSVTLPPQMSLRPTAAAERGPHHAFQPAGSAVSSPQEQPT
jgi:hypothetical protein